MLIPHGTYSVNADDLAFRALNLLSGQPALLFSGNNAVNGGNGIAFGDGLRCAGNSVRRLGIVTPNASGTGIWGEDTTLPPLSTLGGWTAGDTRRFQAWYRNPTGSPCATNFNLSNGIEVVFVP